jgi:hypothetical protein
VLVLDWIFDGDDVLGVSSIDGVDQRGERGRLTRTGRAADQHEAASKTRQPFHLGRQIELGERRHARGQHADRRRGTPALMMEVDPEAAERRHAERSVRDAALLKLPRRVRRQHRDDDRLDVFTIEREIGDRRQQAVNSHHGRPSGNQQQIAAFAPHDFRQPLIDAARPFERGIAGGRGRVQFTDQRIEIIGRLLQDLASATSAPSVAGMLTLQLHHEP